MRSDSNTSIEGDTSRAYAFSGSDVDINDHLSSYSVLFFQQTRPNKMSLGMAFAIGGNYEKSAELFCSHWSIRRAITRKWFNGFDPCVTDLKAALPVLVPPVATISRDEDDEDRHEELVIVQQQEIESFKNELATVQHQLTSRPVVVEKVIDPELKEQLDADAARRAKAREVLKGNK
jgi:hypothetical protein